MKSQKYFFLENALGALETRAYGARCMPSACLAGFKRLWLGLQLFKNLATPLSTVTRTITLNQDYWCSWVQTIYNSVNSINKYLIMLPLWGALGITKDKIRNKYCKWNKFEFQLASLVLFVSRFFFQNITFVVLVGKLPIGQFTLCLF